MWDVKTRDKTLFLEYNYDYQSLRIWLWMNTEE